MKLVLEGKDARKYVEWAKRQLLKLTRLRKDIDLPKMQRSFRPKNNFLVTVMSSDFGDMIRIVGGVSAGRVRRILNSLDRFYYIISNKLEEYQGVPLTSDLQGMNYSFNGKVTGHTVTDAVDLSVNHIRISRRGRDLQEFATELVTNLDIVHTAPLIHTLPIFINGDLWDFNPKIMAKESGDEISFVSYLMLPKTFRVTEAQKSEESLPSEEWSSVTSYEKIFDSVMPSFVTDFYASQSVPHTVQARNTTTPNSSPDAYIAIFRASSAPSGPIGGAPYYFYISGGVGGIITGTEPWLYFRTIFDPFTGRTYLCSVMPFVTSIGPSSLDPDVIEAMVSYKISLHELVASQWNEIYSVTYSDALKLSVNEQSGLITSGPNINGQISINPTSEVRFPNFKFVYANYYVGIGIDRQTAKLGQIVPNREFDPISGVSHPNVPQLYLENGITILSDLPTAPTLDNTVALQQRATDGYLFDLVWYHKNTTAPFTKTTLPPGQMYLSPKGNKLWHMDDESTFLFKYYEDGVELFSETTQLPDPLDPANQALYGVVPERGFHFLDLPRAWSYERELFRFRVAKRIIPNPDFGPAFIWETAEVMLAPENGVLTIKETFSDLLVSYPKDGRFETDPLDVVTFSDADLVQDEFVPHK